MPYLFEHPQIPLLRIKLNPNPQYVHLISKRSEGTDTAPKYTRSRSRTVVSETFSQNNTTATGMSGSLYKLRPKIIKQK